MCELTSSSNSYIRSRYSCDDRLGKPSVVLPSSAKGGLTISVEVMIDANPNPLGMISNHSSKFDVRFSSQNDMSTFAISMRIAERTVSVQYFPVSCIILVLYFSTGRKTWGIGRPHPPAITLPRESATEFGRRCRPGVAVNH